MGATAQRRLAFLSTCLSLGTQICIILKDLVGHLFTCQLLWILGKTHRDFTMTPSLSWP